MPDLKLRRLPDRTFVRISFRAGPELARSLQAYAALYRETYGQAQPLPDLIPYMLESFLAGNRAFVLAQKAGRTDGGRPRSDLFASSPEKEA